MTTKKITVSHRGRKCRYPDCKRELSIYNHSDHCHIHQIKMSMATPVKSFEK